VGDVGHARLLAAREQDACRRLEDRCRDALLERLTRDG
jgi:hypothetical protein